jgi:predicted dehydrogenase
MSPTIGLVGAGRWGSSILRELSLLGATARVCDPASEARAAATDAGAVGAVADLESLADVDAVVVATPATTHADVLCAIADWNVPVFCEKPLTTDVATAREVAARLGDRLHVMHVWRYHAGVERLRSLAADGALGEVHGLRTVRTNWTSPRTDTDSIWTLVPHDLTIAIEVLGGIPAPRAAAAEVLDGRAVSMWAHLGGAGEPWLVIEASTRFADKRREVRVHGSDAVAVLGGLDDDQIVIARGRAEAPILERVRFDGDPPLRRELAAFLEHVAGGPPPKSSGQEGCEVVETIARLRALAGLG